PSAATGAWPSSLRTSTPSSGTALGSSTCAARSTAGTSTACRSRASGSSTASRRAAGASPARTSGTTSPRAACSRAETDPLAGRVETVVQLVLNALHSSSLYALVALGLTLGLGVLDIADFAQGALYMVGAYVAFFATSEFGL